MVCGLFNSSCLHGSILCRHSPGWGWDPAVEEADMLGTPAGFPASASLLASISPPLPRLLSSESVTAFSFMCIYFPHLFFPPSHPPSPSPLFASISPSLPASLHLTLCPITGVTVVQLSKLPLVLVYLTCSNVLSLYSAVWGWNDTAGLQCIAKRQYVYILCFYLK